MTYEVKAPDGLVLAKVGPAPMRPRAPGSVSRTIGSSLQNARPGAYEVRFAFLDELSQSTIPTAEGIDIISS